MKLVEYKNNTNVSVEFEDGFIMGGIQYYNFKTGSVRNPHAPSLCNIGFMGYGKFDGSDISYNVWRGMIERCYGRNRSRIRDLSYAGCTVSEDWHNYQNFAQWYNENYYIIDGQTMMLDKDILFKNNKIYSSDKCLITPNSINMLVNGSSRRDKGECPLGVSFHKKTGKYQANCNNNKSNCYLGLYNTPEEAHDVYKKYKKSVIVETAEKYKSQIPDKLYQALINYEV